ncbi:hypothetical protein RDWZM_007134 [Blomia tropicalis]|uniref:Uncharacterized protein n=1 Tax=Blomia tropicalis TaxID=40697 RepID=A0A9Q0MB53_BLOTA|nr:hypothetical protein BLOT_013694 [Blomia tropicalis]KAJ6221322.1 hypothetical protein RDWZM_007134 [Blomia tropicalis]
MGDQQKEQEEFEIVRAKGQAKTSNPWKVENDGNGEDTSGLKQSTAQVVQSLPAALANDLILKALLDPTLKQIQTGDFPNVVPLKVTYGGTETGTDQSKKSTSKSNIVKLKAHKDKVIEYDKTKGFVSTSWANFVVDSEKQNGKEKQIQLTNNKDGIFVKHVTSTVINPHDLFKGKEQPPLPKASIKLNSFSYTSPILLSNTWSNVLVYTPKQVTYKIDTTKGTFEPVTPDGENNPTNNK